MNPVVFYERRGWRKVQKDGDWRSVCDIHIVPPGLAGEYRAECEHPAQRTVSEFDGALEDGGAKVDVDGEKTIHFDGNPRMERSEGGRGQADGERFAATWLQDGGGSSDGKRCTVRVLDGEADVLQGKVQIITGDRQANMASIANSKQAMGIGWAFWHQNIQGCTGRS
jgi:hypothetical protein